MPSESDIPTETLRRGAAGVAVQIGKSRWTIPTATVAAAILGALGTAYQVVQSDREAMLARVAALEVKAADLAGKRDMDQMMLAEIKMQLARIDAC